MMKCQNMSAASGESPATDASIAQHSLTNLRIIIYLLEYSMCLAILIHTYTVLHQRRMMLCHKELQIWESREQIRRNSQRLRASLLPLYVNTSTCLSQRPIPLPSPSPPTMSTPLTAAPASPKSTSSAQIFSTCSHTPASPPQATFHRVRSLRTTTSARPSARSSRRNGNT